MFGSKQLTLMLTITLVFGFLSGLAIAACGVWLIALGATGSAEFNFFGQKFSSTNVGIAAVFIGGVIIVLVIRRALLSIERLSNLRSNDSSSSFIRQTDQSRSLQPSAIQTLEDLTNLIRGLSNNQKALLSAIAKNNDGIYVGDLAITLRAKRSEIVYRARDLAKMGLIKIEHFTDQLYILSDDVKKLQGVYGQVVRQMLTHELVWQNA